VATPLARAPSALAAGRNLWLTREDRHELGAFTWRGALPVLARFAAEGRAAVVTASTGNHGAATAWAGSRAGIAGQVFAGVNTDLYTRTSRPSAGWSSTRAIASAYNCTCRR